MATDRTTIAFDPSSSVVVRTPPGTGYGNWIGGKVFYEATRDEFVLFYRARRPLEHGRAGVWGIAARVSMISSNPRAFAVLSPEPSIRADTSLMVSRT